MLLSYIGACHPEYPFVEIRKLCSILLVVMLCIYKGLWAIPYSLNDVGVKGGRCY